MMTKNIAVNGILGGLIASTVMGSTLIYMKNNPGSQPNAIIGFMSMLLAFVFLFLGIKSVRDQHAGKISFKKAFIIGTLIALIISTIYVLSWLIIYYNFYPNFIEEYSDMVLKNASQETKAAKIAEMEQLKAWYKSPSMVILLTYLEIFPLGIFVSLIASILLKKNKPILPPM